MLALNSGVMRMLSQKTSNYAAKHPVTTASGVRHWIASTTIGMAMPLWPLSTKGSARARCSPMANRSLTELGAPRI